MKKIELYQRNETELLKPLSAKEINYKTYVLYVILSAVLCLLAFYEHPVVIQEQIHVVQVEKKNAHKIQLFAVMNKENILNIKEQDKVEIELDLFPGIKFKGVISKVISDAKQDRVLINLLGDSEDNFRVAQLIKNEISGVAKITVGKQSILPFFNHL
jgi:hypothetical protein